MPPLQRAKNVGFQEIPGQEISGNPRKHQGIPGYFRKFQEISGCFRKFQETI